jgi:hypothetical protein
MCFVRISEQTTTFALYSFNWLIFIAVVDSVYSAVRIESLYNTDDSSLKSYVETFCHFSHFLLK